MKKIFLGSILTLLSQFSFANVLGDMQTFAPNTDGLDFITVHSARSLNEGHFAFSNYVNIAKDHLLVYRDLTSQDRMNYSSLLSEYDFGISYGFTKSLQMSLMAPILLTYEGETKEGIHVDVSKGVHSLRPGLKWSLYETKQHAAAILLSADVPQVTNSPYTGTQPNGIINFETAYTFRNNNSAHGLNLGYRNRNPTSRPSDGRMFPLHDQLTYSYGYGTKLTEAMRFVFEFIGSYPLNKEPYLNATDAASYDLLFGAKHFWWKYLRFDWGFTVEPGVASLSPTWRVFTGLVYYWKNDVNRPSEAEEEKNFARAYPPASTEQLSPAVDEFIVAPMEAEVFEGEEFEYKVQGGRYPYEFRILDGEGQVDSAGLFQAPTQAGKVRVEIHDQIGQTKIAKVTILPIPKPDREIRLKNLKFIFAKDELIKSSIESLYKDLVQFDGIQIREIIIEGHTDDIGKNEDNKKLGRKRAQAIKNILVERLNLFPKQIKVISYGEEKPLTTNKTAAGRQINRRVELKVYFQK